MADVLNRTTGLTLPYQKDFRESVNTPDFPTVDWIINPDLSGVTGFDDIYWDVSGDTVILVDATTRSARDSEIAAAQDTANRTSEKDRIEDTSPEVLFRALVKVLIDEINILRSQHSLAARTLAQARNAIKSEIDGGI